MKNIKSYKNYIFEKNINKKEIIKKLSMYIKPDNMPDIIEDESDAMMDLAKELQIISSERLNDIEKDFYKKNKKNITIQIAKDFGIINEGLRDKMVGKSEDEILSKLEGLSDNEKIKTIIKYQLDYNLLPRDKNGISTYDDDLFVNGMRLTVLPDNLIVKGDLICYYNNLTKLPDNLIVKGKLYCDNNNLTELPDNLIVKGGLYCSYNNLTELPDNLIVKGNLDCYNNNLTELPDNLIVKGDLYCGAQKSGVKLELPKTAKVKGTFIN